MCFRFTSVSLKLLENDIKSSRGNQNIAFNSNNFPPMFSFTEKKTPKPTHISGPLQAILPPCAPLLSFGFTSELKRQFFASVSRQTASFDYSPATTVSHEYLSLTFILAFKDQGRGRWPLCSSAPAVGPLSASYTSATAPEAALGFRRRDGGKTWVLKVRLYMLQSRRGWLSTF